MTFKKIMEELNRQLVCFDSYGFFDYQVEVAQGKPVPFVEALRELCRAADEGRVVEVPLSGDGETVEVPDLETIKMSEVTTCSDGTLEETLRQQRKQET